MIPAWIRIGSGNHSRKPVVESIHGEGLGVMKMNGLVKVNVGGGLFVGNTNLGVEGVSVAFFGL